MNYTSSLLIYFNILSVAACIMDVIFSVNGEKKWF